MGFLDFLKSKKTVEKEPEKVLFNDFENWLNNKEKEIGVKEKKILMTINNQTLNSINGLKEKLGILENFDLESRKDKDKIKAIVKENWTNYIYYVRKFIEGLEGLKEQKLTDFATKANQIFSNFDQKSYMSYQKATILIGKEMANIKEDIMVLSKHFKKVFDENRDIIDSSKLLSRVKLNINQINEIDKIAAQTQEKITGLNRQTLDIQDKNKKILEEIEKIKQNQEHIENLKKQKEIKFAKEELDDDVNKLRGMINFKSLSNVFHVVKEKHEVVKAHKEEFAKHFHKDDGKSILNLINETKSDNREISNKIKQLSEAKQKIIKLQQTIKKDKTKSLLLEIEKTNLEIIKLENEKGQECKSYERLKAKKQEAKNAIKQILSELDVTIIDD